MSAIGIPPNGRSFVISACGYQHHQLMFERQQSQEMRHMAWEGRLQPLTPWSTILLRAARTLALLGAMAAVAV